MGRDPVAFHLDARMRADLSWADVGLGRGTG